MASVNDRPAATATTSAPEPSPLPSASQIEDINAPPASSVPLNGTANTNGQSSQTLFHDDTITAIQANAPIASQHIIVLTNAHVQNVHELTYDDIPLLKHIKDTALKLLKEAETEVTIGFISSPFSDPQMPIKTHLHAHAFTHIDRKRCSWMRSWVFSGLIFYKLDDLVAEIRESVTNNRIKS